MKADDQTVATILPRVLVVGDVMLDCYTFGIADRVSPESPVLILKASGREIRLGGAGNTAANCQALDADVSIIGLVGDDREGRNLAHLLDEAKIQSLLVVDPDRCTTVKERIVGQAAHHSSQQVVRIDTESTLPAVGEAEEEMLSAVPQALATADVVLISDYGKGVCTPRVLAELIRGAQTRGIPVFVDPARAADWELYRGAACIKPNRVETAAAWGKSIRTFADASCAARELAGKFSFRAVIVTLDRDGMLLLEQDAGIRSFTATSHDVADVAGAGDTVFAVIGVATARGLPLSDAVRLAVVAGDLQVRRQGATTITWQEIARAQLADQSKLVSLASLEEFCRGARKRGERVVFTNGCFDLLHVGHVTYLQEAATLGDRLIVAINSDAAIRRLKGQDRPINSSDHRATVLAALECVDFVTVFDEATPEVLLRSLCPDVLVKGGDYDAEQIAGRDIVLSGGGQVIAAGYYPGVSTSALVEKMRASALP